jgi:uncharacterized membrane protein YkvA (DUF1232 family)
MNDYELSQARYIQGNIIMARGLLYLIGALLYVLFPRDLVPDFLVGWGWLDDLLVLFLLWRYYRRQVKQRRATSGHHQSGQTEDDRQSGAANGSDPERWNPYTVLEIEAGASESEIKAAYRRLAAQYHPDKVQHLGEEIQQLAELRFKEIQRAYDFLIRR